MSKSTDRTVSSAPPAEKPGRACLKGIRMIVSGFLGIIGRFSVFESKNQEIADGAHDKRYLT